MKNWKSTIAKQHKGQGDSGERRASCLFIPPAILMVYNEVIL